MGVLGISNSLLFKGGEKKSPSHCPFTLFFLWIFFFFFFGDSAKELDKNKTALCWVLCEYGVEGKSCGQEGVKQKKKGA